MSIGPSLSTADPATTPTPSQESESFALRVAKRSFEPFNTNPCPQMFADKWRASRTDR